jgi:flavin reductase (DIM6/NTAB) family NADH-FMN oxidoreductase RutF
MDGKPVKKEEMMKKDLGVMPAVFPMPVLLIAAYDEAGTVNVMNAAWGMPNANNKIALFIDKHHKTTKNILAVKAFTVALADVEHMKEADYFGMVSGNKVPDKFDKSGCHAEESHVVHAPVIREFPISLECELAEVIDTDNMFAIVGKIINASAEEGLIGEDGKVDASRINALMFDQFHFDYYRAGERVGKAFSEGRSLIR